MYARFVFVLAVLPLGTIMADTFMYYGYGSNLLAARIHIHNPTARYVTAARLDDYRLDFFPDSVAATWNGSPATIVPHEGSHVWGAVWEIHNTNLATLDGQEGSDYIAKDLSVTTPENKTLVCRVYEYRGELSYIPAAEDRPEDRKPSKTYLQVIIDGAVESKLPKDYIDQLRLIEHNNKIAFQKILDQLAATQDHVPDIEQ